MVMGIKTHQAGMMKTTERDGHPAIGNKIQSNYKTSVADLKALARGQWPSIFKYCGMSSSSFSGKPNI